MRSRVLAVAAVLLVVMLGVAFQWRYDEVAFYGRKQLIRTNRFTGSVQRLSSTGGWYAASNAPTSTPTFPQYATDSLPPCGQSAHGLVVKDTTAGALKICKDGQWALNTNPYITER